MRDGRSQGCDTQRSALVPARPSRCHPPRPLIQSRCSVLGVQFYSNFATADAKAVFENKYCKDIPGPPRCEFTVEIFASAPPPAAYTGERGIE